MKYEMRTTRTPRTRARSRFLTLPPTLILSILAFTTSISAQSSNNPSESATPTTFQTSVSASISISSQEPTPPSLTSASSTPPSNTSPTSNPSNPNNNNNNNGNTNGNTNDTRPAFNYYFLIIAAAIVLLGIALLYYRSQRRQKAFLQRTNSQRALARDVEGFRNRFNFGSGNGAFGIGGGGAYRSGANRNVGGNGAVVVEEGLDERGEAPPPYVEGTKPPSIRETRSDGLPDGTEMRDLGTARPRGGGAEGETVGNAPPSYEHVGDARTTPAPTQTPALPTIMVSSPVNLAPGARPESRESLGDLDLRRPPAVFTAPERNAGTSVP